MKPLLAIAIILLAGCELPDSKMVIDVEKTSKAALETSKDRRGYWDRYVPSDSSPKMGAKERLLSEYLDIQVPVDRVTLPDEMPKEPITVRMDSIPLPDALAAFSELGGIDIILGTNVSTKVDLSLNNVPWNKALETFLASKRLGFIVRENSSLIEVYTEDEVAEIEGKEVERAKKRLELKQLKDGKSVIITTKIFRLNYASVGEVETQLNALFGGGEGEESAAADLTIVQNERTSSVIVRGPRDDVEVAASVINALDRRTPQILIEAIIVEATSNFDTELGSRLGANITGQSGDNASFEISGQNPALDGTNLTLSGDDVTGGTAVDLSIGNPSAALGLLVAFDQVALKTEIQAMATENIANIVSNPKIYALDNQEATVFQGEEVPYQSETDGGGTSVSFKEAGLSLRVKPSVTGDGNILMDVNIEKNKPNYARSVDGNYPIDKSTVTTSLLVKDGAVAVIGGIFETQSSDSIDKVPGISNVPIVGNLFKVKGKGNSGRELIVFLLPKII